MSHQSNHPQNAQSAVMPTALGDASLLKLSDEEIVFHGLAKSPEVFHAFVSSHRYDRPLPMFFRCVGRERTAAVVIPVQDGDGGASASASQAGSLVSDLHTECEARVLIVVGATFAAHSDGLPQELLRTRIFTPRCVGHSVALTRRLASGYQLTDVHSSLTDANTDLDATLEFLMERLAESVSGRRLGEVA